MTKALNERLRDAKSALDQVSKVIGRHPAKLPVEVSASLLGVVDRRSDIDHWIEMLRARAAAQELLRGLEDKVDKDGFVSYGDRPVAFHLVRFLGVQAYVTTTWALADRVSGLVGRILCTPSAGRNEASLPQLVANFIGEDRKKTTAAALFESMRHTFGWPVSISYALRNHFVHDGGQDKGRDFFEGPAASSAFRIAPEGWTFIEERAQEYGVERKHHRVGAGWPSAPRDDLRIVLSVCEQEMDDALGVLLGSACQALHAHVGFMVGDD